MDVTARISSDLLLAALNGEYKFGNHRRQLALGTGLKTALNEEYEESSRKFAQALREYVDIWIETGREQDTEVPSHRRPTLAINRLVQEYSRTHPALALFNKGYKAEVPFLIDEPVTINWETAATDVRYVPTIGLTRHLKQRGAADSPLLAVDAAAKRFFVGMLFTEWCMRIAKCKHTRCGRYYLLAKPRAVYKRGTFCRRCNSARSAVERTREVRALRTGVLMRLAANAVMEWRRKSDKTLRIQKSLKDYIVRCMASKDIIITKKWVTRNMKQIEASLHRDSVPTIKTH